MTSFALRARRLSLRLLLPLVAPVAVARAQGAPAPAAPAPAAPGAQRPPHAQGDGPATAFDSAAPIGAGSTKIKLGPGDRIRLRIWREPDLSGEFEVSTTGIVTIPKLGPMEVVGRDPDSLRSTIVNGYAKYLVNPSLEVVFIHRVQVLGEVHNPNVYYADETMTVGDVLALAGGLTDHARASHIELVREGKRQPFTVTQRTVVGESALRSGDQILVPQKSWLARNPGIVAAAITTAVTVAVSIGLHHY